MKFIYTAIYSLKGIVMTEGEADKLLVQDAHAGIRAVLTIQPDQYAFESDRSLAVAGMILRGLFQAEQMGEDVEGRIQSAVEEISASRMKDYKAGPYLVFTGEGEVPDFESQVEKDMGDFVLRLEGRDKEDIKEQFRARVTAALNSITSVSESVVDIKSVLSSVIFYTEDERPVYSYILKGGAVSAYVSKPVPDEGIERVSQLYKILAADDSLSRVQKLIHASYEENEDKLRSFLNAWTALEIFVNKVFGAYEGAYFESLLEEEHTVAQRKFIERVQGVMKGKYRLSDKFAAIAFQLAPQSADEDLEAFRAFKELRDDLAHGQDVDERTLPVEGARTLAEKYLRLHLERAAS